jgi:MFS family permease
VLGYTQAFSSLGGFMVAGAFWLASHFADSLPTITLPQSLENLIGPITGGNAAWRYTLMSGLIPALPLLLIRPFLPESPVWAQKHAAGTLRRPSIGELFAPQLRRTTIVSTIIFACAYGAAFGAIQQIRQIVPGVPEVKQETAGKPLGEQKKFEGKTAAFLGEIQEAGGLLGRILLAILAVRIVSRRSLLRVFQLPGLILVPLIFALAPTYSLNALTIGAFVAGFFTVSQFSFLGNYLPRVYPVHLRGTGEGFAANIGGRMIGTSFYGATGFLSKYMGGGSPPIQLAYASATIALIVFLIGSIACFWLPEPGKSDLPD